MILIYLFVPCNMYSPENQRYFAANVWGKLPCDACPTANAREFSTQTCRRQTTPRLCARIEKYRGFKALRSLRFSGSFVFWEILPSVFPSLHNRPFRQSSPQGESQRKPDAPGMLGGVPADSVRLLSPTQTSRCTGETDNPSHSFCRAP